MRTTMQTGIAEILFATLFATLSVTPAAAFGHANAFGGHSSGSFGSGEPFQGGSASGQIGEGFTHDNAWGGSTSPRGGGGDGGVRATGMYGATAAGAYGGGAYRTGVGGAYYHPPGAFYPYHPPTVVNHYGAGCAGCGGWSTAGAAATGMVVGATFGAAAVSASTAAAYNAGATPGSAYAVNAVYSTLPLGASRAVVAGNTYYTVAGTWFVATMGAGGVYYTIVPAP